MEECLEGRPRNLTIHLKENNSRGIFCKNMSCRVVSCRVVLCCVVMIGIQYKKDIHSIISHRLS